MTLRALISWLLKSKWLILGIVIFLLISSLYTNKIFSLRFADEEDNLVLGNFLLKNEKLYSDLFSHHQPAAYIISSNIQFVTQPQNIYELIKSHREFMIVWSFLWCVILVFRFKEKIILPLIIFELTKYYLYGNLFLSESLAVYPILYIVLFLFEKNIKPKNYEYFITGFLIGLNGLLLAPIWPFLLGYLILLFWLKKISMKPIFFLAGGVLAPIILSLPFIDIYYYFRNVFYINSKYYIPLSAEEKFPISLLKSFLSPLSVFIYKMDFSPTSLILKITALFYIVSTGFLIKKKKFKLLIAGLILLTLANLRYYTPGLEYFAGFHLQIWYSLFILISFYFYSELFENTNSKYIKISMIFILTFSLILITYFAKDLFLKNNPEENFKENYSQVEEYGNAIKNIKNPEDTLFVIPDEWLLYSQSGLKNNNRMINFYGWMSLVWELNDPVLEKFKTDPPTFFYCDCEEKTVYSYSDQYVQIKKSGIKTPLWILNTKFNSLSEEQKNLLRARNFQF